RAVWTSAFGLPGHSRVLGPARYRVDELEPRHGDQDHTPGPRSGKTACAGSMSSDAFHRSAAGPSRDVTPLADLSHGQPRAGPVRERRPVYVDLLPPCNASCPAGENIQAWLAHATAG